MSVSRLSPKQGACVTTLAAILIAVSLVLSVSAAPLCHPEITTADCDGATIYVNGSGSYMKLKAYVDGTWLATISTSSYATVSLDWADYPSVDPCTGHTLRVDLYSGTSFMGTDSASFGGPDCCGEPPYVDALKLLSTNEICLNGELAISLVAVGRGDSGSERMPLDVILVLDRSGSMEGTPLADLKTAATAFVNKLDPALDRVGLVSYATAATLNRQLTADFAGVKTAIDAMVASGYTNIGQGVNYGQAELASIRHRAEAVPVLIVFTDGVANRKTDGGECTTWPTTATACTNDATAQAEAAKAAGTTVFAIGLFSGLTGEYASCLPLARATLQIMASDPANYYEAPTSADLEAVFEAIAYTITQLAARDVVLTEVLPAHVHYVAGSAVPTPGGISGQTLWWNAGQLDIGERYTATLRVTLEGLGLDQLVDVYPDSDVTYTNYEGQHTVVPFPETYVDVVAALLSFAKTGPDVVKPGETFAYQLSYENDGNGLADPVILTDVLPAEVAYLASDPPGAEGPLGTVVFDLGSAPPGGPYTALLTVTVGYDVESGQELVNTLRWGYGACWGCGTGQTTFTQTVCSQGIEGLIWNDAVENGVQDDPLAEPGLANIEVALLLDDGVDYPVLAHTLTDAQGHYFFDFHGLGLGPGDYRVDVNQSYIYINLRLFDSAYTPEPRNVAVAECRTARADFGYLRQGGVIGDLVWYDVNNNSLQDEWNDLNNNDDWTDEWNDANGDGRIQEGELARCGLRFVDTTINRLDGNGGFPRTSETDTFGYYRFLDLPTPALYEVVIDQSDPDFSGGLNEEMIGGQCKALPSLLAAATGSRVLAHPASIAAAGLPRSPSVPTQAASISGLVRNDTDADGDLSDADSGLAGVTLTLYNDNDGSGRYSAGDDEYGTATSSADGSYSFVGVPLGDYVIVEDDPAGYGSTADADLPNDNEIGVQVAAEVSYPGNDFLDTRVVCWMTTGGGIVVYLAADEVYLDADFAASCSRADYQISKTVNTVGPVRTGDPISFTIRITNTSDLPISILPLRDIYSPTYLVYGYGSQYAVPDSFDHDPGASGQIEWPDLVQSFGHELAPDEAFGLIVHFTALKDTEHLPDHTTVNTATVPGGWADPDGSGTLGPIMPIPSRSDDDRIGIMNPTGLAMGDFWAEVHPAAALVGWQTAGEADLLGFNLLRSQAGATGRGGRPTFVQANAEMIPAQYTGADQGAAYSYLDGGLAADSYTYVLQIIHLDGSIEPYGEVAVIVP